MDEEYRDNVRKYKLVYNGRRTLYTDKSPLEGLEGGQYDAERSNPGIECIFKTIEK